MNNLENLRTNFCPNQFDVEFDEELHNLGRVSSCIFFHDESQVGYSAVLDVVTSAYCSSGMM